MQRILATILFAAILSGQALSQTGSFEWRNLGWLPGVNLSAGGFNSKSHRIGFDYTYPEPAHIDYYTAKGFRIFRIPFLARRLITTPMGRIAEDGKLTQDIEVLDQLIRYAARKGAYVILDMHNYGSIFTAGLIGRDEGSTQEFAAAWRLIARRVREHPNVMFGLMNEPNKQTAKEWLVGANAAIAAIREVGARQLVLVPGSYWDAAHSWVSTDNAKVMLGIIDPADNYVYEVHQYLDSNSSGTHADVVEGAGRKRLQAFTAWARSNRKRGFLGEFGWADNDRAHSEGEALLDLMSANRDVWLGWTYWAGGPWWGNYIFSVEPKDGRDRPQMEILSKYVR